MQKAAGRASRCETVWHYAVTAHACRSSAEQSVLVHVQGALKAATQAQPAQPVSAQRKPISLGAPVIKLQNFAAAAR